MRKASDKYQFDSDHRKKDVGLHFKRALVLLSNDFRYLGREGTEDKRRYPKIARLIEDLAQGHRRHYSVKLRKEHIALKADIWRKYRWMKVGLPTESDRSWPCNHGYAKHKMLTGAIDGNTEDYIDQRPRMGS